MIHLRAFVLGGLAAVGLTASAHAAMIDRSFDLTAADFVQTFGSDPTPPLDPVHMSVTFSFDDSADIGTTTTGLTVNSFDLPYSAEWQYFAGSDGIALATNLTAPATCSSAQATFCAFIHDVTSASPTLAFFQNSLPTAPHFNVWRANELSLTYTDRAVVDGGGAPEPAAWALMLIGFGGVGAAQRAARRSAPAHA